jgi:GDPmannose 4,6-dehydratase
MRALILGITGQDGSYLAELLLAKNYEVHGLIRRSSTSNTKRIDHFKDQVVLHQGDLLDPVSVEQAILKCEPTEIYNEADQDHVGWSYHLPIYSYNVTFTAVGSLLEAVLKYVPQARVFQPVSATMFGDTPAPQSEQSAFNPQSPYACAKVGAYHLCRYYRQHHGLYVSTGIMFNHDSERRAEHYLVNKICRAVIRISRGEQELLTLGHLDYKVDIGYAKEFVVAIHSILQLDQPDDYVVATGRPCTVRELALSALRCLGLHPDRLRENPKYPKQKGSLVGNTRKLSNQTQFTPYYYGGALTHRIIEQLATEVFV